MLARVRRRWLTARSMRATARVTSVAFVFLLFLLLTDRFLRPADLPMVALFLAALLLVATVFVRTVWSLRRAPTDRQIARFIEERCPALEDRLASATDLARGGDRSAFRDLVVGDAARRTPRRGPGPRRPQGRGPAVDRGWARRDGRARHRPDRRFRVLRTDRSYRLAVCVPLHRAASCRTGRCAGRRRSVDAGPRLARGEDRSGVQVRSHGDDHARRR